MLELVGMGSWMRKSTVTFCSAQKIAAMHDDGMTCHFPIYYSILANNVQLPYNYLFTPKEENKCHDLSFIGISLITLIFSSAASKFASDTKRQDASC